MKNEKRGKSPLLIIGIIILIMIFCICCAGSVFLLFSWAASLDIESSENIIQKGSSSEKIAVIKIYGPITTIPETGLFSEATDSMVDATIKKLDKAMSDNNVQAIILDINSPGGEVYGTELIANKIDEIKTEGIFVVALLRDTAASGGYYIAAKADNIIASHTTVTGSIGVFFQLQDLEGLYEKLGIKTYYVVNSEGDLKVVRGELEDKDSKAYQVLQSIADDTYDQFVSVIAEGRNMSRNEVIKIADGRVYSGLQAKELGLVDELGYFETAVEQAKKNAELSDPTIYEINRVNLSWSSFDAKIKSMINIFGIEIGDTKNQENMKVMYRMPY